MQDNWPVKTVTQQKKMSLGAARARISYIIFTILSVISAGEITSRVILGDDIGVFSLLFGLLNPVLGVTFMIISSLVILWIPIAVIEYVRYKKLLVKG